MKTSAVGLAGAGLGTFFAGSLFEERLALAAEVKPLDLKLEKDPVIRVLPWSGLVKSDEENWNANQRNGKRPRAASSPPSISRVGGRSIEGGHGRLGGSRA